MYLSNLTARNFRQFGEGDAALDIAFNSGVTALVGRNDSGKSAVIDAIRHALLTRDQDFIRVQPEDFHIDTAGRQASEMFVRCTLSGLDDEEKGAFAEYLSYVDSDVSLFVNWTAKVSFRQRCPGRFSRGARRRPRRRSRRARVTGGLLSRSEEIVGCRAAVTRAGWARW